MAKISGTGGIDFSSIARILLFALGLYVVSASLTFLQSWLMTGVTQKICFRDAARDRGKDRPHAHAVF